MPTVAEKEPGMNFPWSNCTNRDVFPTPLSPTRIVCKKKKDFVFLLQSALVIIPRCVVSQDRQRQSGHFCFQAAEITFFSIKGWLTGRRSWPPRQWRELKRALLRNRVSHRRPMLQPQWSGRSQESRWDSHQPFVQHGVLRLWPWMRQRPSCCLWSRQQASLRFSVLMLQVPSDVREAALFLRGCCLEIIKEIDSTPRRISTSVWKWKTSKLVLLVDFNCLKNLVTP